MSDSAEKRQAKAKTQAEKLHDEGMFDPQDLVSKGGYVGNPREIIENPAVAPEMLDRPEDLRDDLLAETEDDK
jgi:Gas vesicles protein GVPc repeated domain